MHVVVCTVWNAQVPARSTERAGRGPEMPPRYGASNVPFAYPADASIPVNASANTIPAVIPNPHCVAIKRAASPAESTRHCSVNPLSRE